MSDITKLYQDFWDNARSAGVKVDLPTKERKPRKKAIVRRYDLVATNFETTIKWENVTAHWAGAHKRMLRRDGFKVSLYEVSNLSGIVEPVTDELGGKGVPNPVCYYSPRMENRTREAAMKIRALMMSKVNNSNVHDAEVRDSQTCRMYEKHDNKLRFSGSIFGLCAYMQQMINQGIWDPEKYVLYLPAKLMEAIV
jgi:hypothetical protein